MKNYISINDKKIELTPEQVKKIVDACGIGKVRLKDVAAGSLVRIAGTDFVVLEQIDGKATALITRHLIEDDEAFGENNNFDGSNADETCGAFGEALAEEIGAENILAHDVDLTADDGLKDYGVIERNVSLLTCDLYRRYVYILDKFKVDAWWWLATAFSTKAHGYERAVKCVAPSGYFDYGGSCNCSGVRPFCILNSNIFVSLGEEK